MGLSDAIRELKNFKPNEIKQEEPYKKQKQFTDKDFRFNCLHRYKTTENIEFLAKGLMEGKDNSIVTLPKMQLEILNFITHNQDLNLNIQAPVGHGKTILIGIVQTHNFVQSPSSTCLYLSESDGIAKDRIYKIGEYLKRYYSILGESFKLVNDNTTEFRLVENQNPDPSIKAKGILSKFTGSHVDTLIMDDVETIELVPLLDKVIEKYDTVVTKRLNIGGKMIAINTPYAVNGFLSKLEREPSWRTLKISLPTNLIREELLDPTKILVKDVSTNKILSEKIIALLDRKLIFNAIEMINKSDISLEEKKVMSSMCRQIMDFRYTKQVIEFGELIEEEEIIEPWDFKVQEDGQNILTSFLTAPRSYYLTLALNTQKGLDSGIFTAHKEAKISLEEFRELKRTQKSKKCFSYDISGRSRNGTVITEAEVFENVIVITAQELSMESTDAIENNINFYPDRIHVIENNGLQGEIIRILKKTMSDQQKKNIIEHHTGKIKNDMIQGVVGMNKAFKMRELLFLNNGEGIDNLMSELTRYTGIKTKKDQFDPIDSIWFIFFNSSKIRRKSISKSESTNNTYISTRYDGMGSI